MRQVSWSALAWTSAAGVALVGSLGAMAGLGAGWLVPLALGLAFLASRGARTPAPLAGAFGLAVVASLPMLGLAWRVAAGASAAQLVLVALTPLPRARRRPPLVAIVGHVAMTSGALLGLFALHAASYLTLAAGFALLLLHALWTQRLEPGGDALDGWETVVLASTVVGLGAMTLVYTSGLGALAVSGRFEALAVKLALVGALVAFTPLCRPPRAPAFLRSRASTVVDTLAHGAAGIALLNILFLGFSLVSRWSLRLVFGALFAWQMLVIVMELRTVRHAERRRRRVAATPAPKLDASSITALVCACDESNVLADSLAHNLAVHPDLRFVVVPATKSRDDTLEIAERYARAHPDRVRVVLGDTGSKAEDLNKAWKTLTTDLVLMLDADETTDAASLARAARILRENPDCGLVQGRKVSRAPEDGWLARFISAERRYSTWMDHVMHGEDLGSGHFGGSAALVRRQVPLDVGGWTERTLTEDIEFTLRLHLHGGWRIVYSPEFVVREADPATFAALLRQRTRWARGWAQCFRLYYGDIVRARRRLGAKRAFGLTLLLLIAISALWTTLVPATLLLRLAGISPILPIAVAFPLTLLLLPGRYLAYSYAAFRDPVIPRERGDRAFVRILELGFQAYLWILLGWFVQLHALYLELSSAPRVWYVTAKRRLGAPGRAAL